MAAVRGYRRRRHNRWPGLRGAGTAIAAHDGASGNAGATGCLVTISAMAPNLIVGSQFLTARAAARHMVPRGRGAIVFLSASLTGQFIPYMSGITAACGAVEALSRTLATELAPACA